MRTILSAALTAFTVLVSTGSVQAAPTPEGNCLKALASAWGAHVRCIDDATAKLYAALSQGTNTDFEKAFLKCRKSYFKKWTKFQTKSKLVGSTCVGDRFVDNVDGTVTDNLSRLVWEKKTDDDSVHDTDNIYTWSTGSPFIEDGTLFTDFLDTLNDAGFAGANGWRIPTLAEVHSIQPVFPSCKGEGGSPTCQCNISPCLLFDDPDTQTAIPTFYWTNSTSLWVPDHAYVVSHDIRGITSGLPKITGDLDGTFARAVRGGI